MNGSAAVQSPRDSLRSLSPRAAGLSTSGSTRSCNSDSDQCAAATLPFYISLLENLTFEVEANKQRHDVRYVLRVRRENKSDRFSNMNSGSTADTATASNGNSGDSVVVGNVTIRQHDAWSLSRSFDEYREFQQKVIKLMNHGHFCSAECPWLMTFLTSYFPRNHVFRNKSKCVMAQREESLKKFFQTFQTFLCTKENHSCGILVDVIAKELVAFVYGELVSFGSPLASASILWQWQRQSISNDEADEDDDDDGSTSPSGEEQDHDSATNGETNSSSASSPVGAVNDEKWMLCPLCDSSLHEQANSGIKSIAPGTGRRASRAYITRLGCGHLFHDECIVPKLNESLNCPTCGRQVDQYQ